MIEHLKEHISAGHTVPAHVIPTLEQEIKKDGDLISEPEKNPDVEAWVGAEYDGAYR